MMYRSAYLDVPSSRWYNTGMNRDLYLNECEIGPWEQRYMVLADGWDPNTPDGCACLCDAEGTFICYVDKENADLLIEMLVEGHAAMWAKRRELLDDEERQQ